MTAPYEKYDDCPGDVLIEIIEKKRSRIPWREIGIVIAMLGFVALGTYFLWWVTTKADLSRMRIPY